MPSIAIVTGASSGLGREFVRQIDAGGFGGIDEIWAIARRADRLDALVRTCKLNVRPLCLDLTDPASFKLLAASLAETEDARISLLVNAAGFGTFGDFACQGRSDAGRMASLLMLAPVELTYLALPYMRTGSRIVNISSVAAFLPQPRLAVYSASKRFLLDLSRSLDTELGDVGIHVTAVCPKFMRTGFLDAPGDGEAARRMTAIGFERPERVVSEALRAARAGRNLCITSPDMLAWYALSHVLPYKAAIRAERMLGIL